MSVVLKNTSKKMQIHDLPHDYACEGEEDDCYCVDTTILVSVLNPESGEKAFRHVDKTISDSVHIAVGLTSRPLPARVLSVPSIKAALAARELTDVTPKVEEKTEEKKVEAPAVVEAPAPSPPEEKAEEPTHEAESA